MIKFYFFFLILSYFLLFTYLVSTHYLANQTKTINFFHKEISRNEKFIFSVLCLMPSVNVLATFCLSFYLLVNMRSCIFVFNSEEDKRVRAIKFVLLRENDSLSKTLKSKQIRELFDSILISALDISKEPSFKKTNIVGFQENVLINIPNRAYASLDIDCTHEEIVKLRRLHQEMEKLKMLLQYETLFDDVPENTTSEKPSLRISFSKK